MPTLTADGRRLNGRGSGWIARYRRLAIYLRDEWKCLYCQRDLTFASWREITLDHLRPQCKGGRHSPANLITACLSCNSKRANRRWQAFANAQAVVRINRQRYLGMQRFIRLAKAIYKELEHENRA